VSRRNGLWAAVRRDGVENGERISAALADVAKPMVLQGKEIWLGGLDSNQDSQIQNLKSCQLDDLPTSVRGFSLVTQRVFRGRAHKPRTKTSNKNEPQHVPGFGTAAIQHIQIKRLSLLRQPACSGFLAPFRSSASSGIISPLDVNRNCDSPQVMRLEKKLPSQTAN
jgi:hypothetical protein